MRENYPVIEGAESFLFEGNEIGILISHGFIGTPQSVRFLGEEFAKLGYTVLAPRLKGHGTHYKDLEKATRDDWVQDLVKAYEELKQKCTSVFIVGQSMGGTLALFLASQFPEIKGVILINPALSVPSYEYLNGKPTLSYVHETATDIKLEGVEEITYKKIPVSAIHQLQVLMSQTVKIVPTIGNSLFCFKSTEDHVVPPECTDFILNKVKSNYKEVKTLMNSYHVASMDHEKEVIVDETHHFIQKQLNSVAFMNRNTIETDWSAKSS